MVVFRVGSDDPFNLVVGEYAKDRAADTEAPCHVEDAFRRGPTGVDFAVHEPGQDPGVIDA